MDHMIYRHSNRYSTIVMILFMNLEHQNICYKIALTTLIVCCNKIVSSSIPRLVMAGIILKGCGVWSSYLLRVQSNCNALVMKRNRKL